MLSHVDPSSDRNVSEGHMHDPIYSRKLSLHFVHFSLVHSMQSVKQGLHILLSMNWPSGQEHFLASISNRLPSKHLSHEVALLHAWQFLGQFRHRLP